MLMAYASSMAGSMRNPRCRLNYCSRKCPIKHRTRDSGSTAERAGVKAPCSRERPRLPSAPRQITLERERKQARPTNEKRTQETSRCRGSPEGEEEVLRLGVVAIQYDDARNGH